ncbi:hypothetical protein AB0957_34075, partial [Streptomyces zhihengii]
GDRRRGPVPGRHHRHRLRPGTGVGRSRRHPQAGLGALVLGCTHYELVAERIRAAVAPAGDGPAPVFHGSADAVAAQALRRSGIPAAPDAEPTGRITVLLSGRESVLPPAALAYAEGRLLRAAAPAL